MPPPYPAVLDTDWCGRFSLVGGLRGTPSKITDELVISMVSQSWEAVARADGSLIPGCAIQRAVLIRDLMEHGVSHTPALKRVEKLVAQGRLCSGDDPAGKLSGICVWPAPVAEVKEAGKPGRPVAIGQDELRGMISELAPGRESAVSLRAIHRALGGRLSLGALHSAVKELVASGSVVQDSAGVYISADMEVES